MPVGSLVNVGAVLFGSLFGALLGKRAPEKLKESLPVLFGVVALSLGIVLLVGVKNLSAVALALVIGTIIGEMLNLQDGINNAASKLQKKISKGDEESSKNLSMFMSMLVLFCASGTGIFGVLNEGITGDPSILFTKSILDFFTAIIFATTVGYLMMTIAIPQFILYMILFFAATLIMPLVSETMIADFKACGGIITICVGIRLLDIKPIRAVNILPSLILVMPISSFWTSVIV